MKQLGLCGSAVLVISEQTKPTQGITVNGESGLNSPGDWPLLSKTCLFGIFCGNLPIQCALRCSGVFLFEFPLTKTEEQSQLLPGFFSNILGSISIL